MRKNIVLFSVLFSLMFSVSFAADKIYTMGYLVGIVADDLEWSCETRSGSHPMRRTNGNYIQGTSKHFPLMFVFYENSYLSKTYNIETFLRDFAVKTNTVLFDVTEKENTDDKVILEGSFFDNSTSGHFQFYSQKIGGIRFIMFSKINSDLLDDHSRTILYNSAHDLITTLYNPKALMLWTEEVKNTKKLEEFKSFRGQGNP